MSDIVQHPLPRYLNARVQIHYNITSGVQDAGTLLSYDCYWAELRKDNGEHLLIPVAAIRIIKLLDKPDPNAEARILLRPAGEAPPRQIEGDK